MRKRPFITAIGEFNQYIHSINWDNELAERRSIEEVCEEQGVEARKKSVPFWGNPHGRHTPLPDPRMARSWNIGWLIENARQSQGGTR